MHGPRVTLQRGETAARVSLPDFDGAILAAGQDVMASRAEAHGGHAALMPLEDAQATSIRIIPDAECTVAAARHSVPTIGAQRDRQYLVGVACKSSQALPCRDLPQ